MIVSADHDDRIDPALLHPARGEMFIEPITLQTLKAPLGAEGEKPMANTFSQIYIQTVFAVNGRLSLVRPEFKEDLYKYITGIVRNNGQKLISINGMSDHIHILIGLKPAMALADLVRDIKADSSNFINKKKRVCGKFSWQEGYGAFSYGHSQLDTIIRYIQNQERHHKRRSFKDEYLAWLRKYEIAFEDKYVFEFIE
jgi:putative transposase